MNHDPIFIRIAAFFVGASILTWMYLPEIRMAVVVYLCLAVLSAGLGLIDRQQQRQRR